jgi:hypothetical protein
MIEIRITDHERPRGLSPDTRGSSPRRALTGLEGGEWFGLPPDIVKREDPG